MLNLNAISISRTGCRRKTQGWVPGDRARTPHGAHRLTTPWLKVWTSSDHGELNRIPNLQETQVPKCSPVCVRPNLAQQVHGSLPWTFGASGMSGLRAVFGLGWPKESGGHLNAVGAVLAEGQFCWLQGVGSSRCLGTSGSRVKAWRGVSGILAAPNSSYHSITALWHSSTCEPNDDTSGKGGSNAWASP